jgi:hypothetical protein
VNDALERAREQEAAETRLKILEDGRDKLVSLADALHAEIEDKTGKELIKLNEEILYKKGYIQNMAQTLMTTDNPDMLVRAQVALDKANKAANNSCIRIIGLRKKLKFPANRIRGCERHRRPASSSGGRQQNRTQCKVKNGDS